MSADTSNLQETKPQAEDSEHATLELEYPAESWVAFMREHFGPSMLWALTAIGSSHIILAPTIGGLYGVFGIWIAAVIFLVKYGGWELGVRYSYGVGRNPVKGYGELPGPNHWAQWVALFIIVLPQTIITGAVGTGAASFTAALIPGLNMLTAYVLLIGIATVLVLFSSYSALETILKLFVVSLGLLAFLGTFVAPPSPNIIAETSFKTPDFGSTVFLGLFAAMAGFAPTGLGTTITLGSWSIAKKQGARALRTEGLDPNDDRYHDYIAAWIRTGRRDFNIAYGFTFILIVAMILLAANVLYPNPPTNENLAIVTGQLLQNSFGAWAYWAMIIGGFAALYSTVITLLDGAPRVASDILPMVLERDMDTERTRKMFVLFMAVVSLVPVLAIGSLPVTLVVGAAVMVAVFQFFYYIANYYIVRKHLPEPFQPGTAATSYYAIATLLVFVFGLLGAAARLGIIG
ncbi:Nramp family divalent metal transporter [Haladaptatus caseinilyticus]|uniref:Nramp family divalent metal transporter n=1 Tax=Haladaptatus caseinilyticus TaxID=2993314 RepID=UPI00224A7D67|nr:Nramp family divalent metal transporter [Haladaptatus caseinilyticus]